MPISKEEFEKLPTEKAPAAGVKTEELLEFLSEQACTTAEVAQFLGVKQGSAYGRLRRLLQQGKVEVRYSGAKAYWIAKK